MGATWAHAAVCPPGVKGQDLACAVLLLSKLCPRAALVRSCRPIIALPIRGREIRLIDGGQWVRSLGSVLPSPHKVHEQVKGQWKLPNLMVLLQANAASYGHLIPSL